MARFTSSKPREVTRRSSPRQAVSCSSTMTARAATARMAEVSRSKRSTRKASAPRQAETTVIATTTTVELKKPIEPAPPEFTGAHDLKPRRGLAQLARLGNGASLAVRGFATVESDKIDRILTMRRSPLWTLGI